MPKTTATKKPAVKTAKATAKAAKTEAPIETAPATFSRSGLIEVERDGAERQTISEKALDGYRMKGFNVIGGSKVISEAATPVVPVADVSEAIDGVYDEAIGREDVGV